MTDPDLNSSYNEREPDVDLDAEPAPVLPRVPHMGHAFTFLGFTGLMLLLAVALLLLRASGTSNAGATAVMHPKLQLAAMVLAYLASLTAAWFFFPLVWHRSLVAGIQWNWPAARQQAWKLIPAGLLASALALTATRFITPTKPPMLDDFLLKPIDAWLITAFGTFVAPLFEEIAFRGFLMPAFAIAYDWVGLDRTEASRRRWQTTSTLSPIALAFSALMSSGLFALLHGQQVNFEGAAMLVLFCVSLFLTAVRIRTQSVAASTLVHASYNGFVFLLMIAATGGYRHLERMKP